VRNRGLITAKEQQCLRQRRVAIAGMGGIGGIDLVTLARLGIGRFTIADPDVFEVSNTNRQYGATRSALGRSKADVLAEVVRDINPEVELRVFREPIGPDNVVEFLRDADLFVDAVDFFNIDARRLLFRQAAQNGIHAITAGPVGFSGIWIVFDPAGMSFDQYFDLSDQLGSLEKVVAFGVGVAPKATQRSYMDLGELDPASHAGPSSSLACQVAGGAAACEAIKILLGRGRVKCAPYYHQFDPFLGKLAVGRLHWGNRHPWQRLKRWWLTRLFAGKVAGSSAASARTPVLQTEWPSLSQRSSRLIETIRRTSANLWRRISAFGMVNIVEGLVLRRQIEKFYLIISGHIYFETLSAAVELDLFGFLSKHGRLSGTEIATRLGIEEKPARILLLGCAALGLLRKRGAMYSNSRVAQRLLVRESPRNVISIIRWQHHINYRPMYRFYDAIKANRNVGLDEYEGNESTLYERLAHKPELEAIFQEAMEGISVQANAMFSRFVDLSNVRHLVDVGGGNGTNAMALAAKYTHLRADVFDSPSVCRIARAHIEQAGLSARVGAVEGDCFNDPFPRDADCFLFSHFLTIWSEDENRYLLRKAFDALPVGGRVMVFNMMQHDSETGPLSAAMGSPYFLTLATGKGMLYCWREYESWIKQAGFATVKRQRLPRDHGVLIGIKG
jgi:molybdopterin/thiamine biosynthesis adenylyltransferase